MNGTSDINTTVLTRDTVLNNLVYLMGDSQTTVNDNTSVNDILKAIEVKKDQNVLNEDCLRKFNAIKNAIKNDPSIGNLYISNQTSHMTDPKTGIAYEQGGINACTFQDKLNNPDEVTVVFRGTGGGEWVDNGIGLSGTTPYTDQQRQATEYFDTIVEQNRWNDSKPDIYISGHSKGGNKTQFVVMTSVYSDLIINGYSLDGQCMSPETIEYLKQLYGEDEYNRRREKLYSFSADNDYVNVLGVNNDDGRVIPNDHIFYLESNLFLQKWHCPDCFLNEDGTLTDFTEQGEVSLFLTGLSEVLMDLPSPIRSIVTNGVMGIFEITLGNGDPVNGETISWAQMLTSIAMFLEIIPAGIIEELGDKYGIDLDWLAHVIAVYSLLISARVNIKLFVVGSIVDAVSFVIEKAEEIKEKLSEFGGKCKEITAQIITYISSAIDNFKTWLKEQLNAGYKYSLEHPYIRVNTDQLRSYGDRLIAVNRRIGNLDSKMDSLYWQVGWGDLWNLLQADILTSQSWRLQRCANYLYDTATDFENVEKDLVTKI